MMDFGNVDYILSSEHEDPELQDLSDDVERYCEGYFRADKQKKQDYFEELLQDTVESYNTVFNLRKYERKESTS
ncbi:hypothetical protein GLU60_02885 [Nanohaloarchaea archaeon H01]|nr:hypothetical protein [Nanohaloarchaea archaeon H01]